MTLNELINELQELQENGYGNAVVIDAEQSEIYSIIAEDNNVIIDFEL